MTLEQVDQLLADWQKKIDLISQNLIDLQGLSTYQKLAGDIGVPRAQLRGVTAARVTPALEAMNELFQYFDLLLKTIERAKTLRSSVSRFLVSEHKVQEIEQLLTGPSIQLAVVQTPLAQRGLLSVASTTNSITPAALLTAMIDTFQAVKNVVLAVDEAWSRSEERLAEADTKITSLQKLAGSIVGAASLSELTVAQERLRTWRDRIEQDPLGVSVDLDRDINPLILQVKTTLGQMVEQQAQLQQSLANAHQLLKQLVELHVKAETAFAESREKVTDCSPLQPPLPQEQIVALEAWLTRLVTKYNEGLRNPVQIGLENWTVKVKHYIATEEAAWTANRVPVETRQELRGRLDALKAKALARGLAEDALLSQLGEQAQQLLYTRPTPLAKVVELVAQYEKRLSSNRFGF